MFRKLFDSRYFFYALLALRSIPMILAFFARSNSPAAEVVSIRMRDIWIFRIECQKRSFLAV